MQFACSIAKGTDKHSEYVMFVVFSRRQWLHERASVLIFIGLNKAGGSHRVCHVMTITLCERYYIVLSFGEAWP